MIYEDDEVYISRRGDVYFKTEEEKESSGENNQGELTEPGKVPVC